MAKTETTVRGYVYTVTSPNGGTVTDAEGKLNKPVDAGDQVTVTAPSDSLTCDDDEAVICKANFKSPLLALRLLGQGENSLPPGYMQASFLESTGEQYIDLEFKPNNESGIRGVHHTTAAENILLAGTRNVDSRWLAAIARGGAVSDGFGWNAWNSWGLVNSLEKARGWLNFKNDRTAKLEYSSGKVSVKDITGALYQHNISAYLFAYNYDGVAGMHYKGKVFSAELSQGSDVVRKLVPALSPEGTPCMYDRVSGKAFVNKGSGHFVLGMTFGQASKLGMTLPAGGGDLHISLPAGWEQNSKVRASLALAGVRLWNIFPRTTAAATTATTTFALRRLWVRKIADAMGAYVANDGSRWRVEWCEEVFGADPETLGFERFRSVEAAVAYWELQPYVDPEAMDDIMGDNGTLEQGDTENTSPEQNS